MSEHTDDIAQAEAEAQAGAMPVAKRWKVDVLETAKRVVTVESFTRSEAKHRAKNAAFWIERGEATETVKSKPSGSPVEVDSEGKPVPKPEPSAPTSATSRRR